MTAIAKRMRPLSPGQWQPADDPILLLAQRGVGGCKSRVQRALDDLQKAATAEAILAALNTLSYDQVLIVLTLDDGGPFDTALKQAIDRLPEIHDAAGETLNPAFDRLAAGARTGLAEYRDATVDEIASTTEQTIKGIIQDGLASNTPFEDIAKTIKDVIGVTPKQALAIQNYRRALETPDLSALRRALRDERYDDAVRGAYDAETRLPQKLIDRLVASYARRTRAYRAWTIAKTETRAAANLGARAGAEQAGADRRFWRTSMLENVCPLCLSIPILNPVGVPMDQPFASIAGPVDEPIEDTHPACSCGISYYVGQQSLPLPQQQRAA